MYNSQICRYGSGFSAGFSINDNFISGNTMLEAFLLFIFISNKMYHTPTTYTELQIEEERQRETE